MNDNEKIIYCERCGAEMKENARYCMKCGNLNYNHPDNKNMSSFADVNQNGTYEIGSGKNLSGRNSGSMLHQATNTGNKVVFFTVNVLCLVLLFAICGFMYLGNYSQTLVPVVLAIGSLIFLYIISLELIFMKANKPWWAALIPIYNFMIFAEITIDNKILGLLLLIPIVNLVVLLLMFYKLGIKFKRQPLFTVVFAFIMLPVIAFSTSLYCGVNYVNYEIKNDLEKDYKRKKMLLSLIILMLFTGAGLGIYYNMDEIINFYGNIKKRTFVANAEKIIKKTEKLLDENKLVCDDNNNFESGTTKYIIYNDVIGDLKINGFSNELVEAIVEVYNDNNTYKYTLTLTDGTYGFDRVKREDISIDTVKENVKVEEDENISYCYIA